MVLRYFQLVVHVVHLRFIVGVLVVDLWVFVHEDSVRTLQIWHSSTPTCVSTRWPPELLTIHKDVLCLEFSCGNTITLPIRVRYVDNIWWKVYAVVYTVLVVGGVLHSVAHVACGAKVSVQYSPEVVYLLLKVWILDNANEMLHCLDVLLILLGLAY